MVSVPLITALSLLGTTVFTQLPAGASGGSSLDPVAVRMAAQQAGLAALSSSTPSHPGIERFVKDPADTNKALKTLGKALFWDMQVGSDGQACASCHFAAGADNRTKNQINPGFNAGDNTFGNSGVAGTNGLPQFAPNYTLTPADFPTHQDGRDTNDVVSSQGVFRASFTAVRPGVISGAGTTSANANDAGTPLADTAAAGGNNFNVNGVNVRRVEPRNTPTVINAGFNYSNFWDGRASHCFNGVNPIGPLLDQGCGTGSTGSGVSAIYTANGTTVAVAVGKFSLASQADGPVLSPNEMSYVGRKFPDVGHKLLTSPAMPLALQSVDPNDSLLGSKATPAPGFGLTASYTQLIKAAFRPEFTDGTFTVTDPDTHIRYSQMELNFPLYFGLSVGAYMESLISNDSPFDRFMKNTGSLSPDQLRGLATFINTPATAGSGIFKGIAVGNCVSCHAGPEFTEAALTTLAKPVPGHTGAANSDGLYLTELAPTAQMSGGNLMVNNSAVSLRDRGFANIGVRPTAEDIGRGGTLNNHPASFVRQGQEPTPNTLGAPPLPSGCSAAHPCSTALVDGAVKIPSLRNIDLTGPYFHNGGQATLRQVLDFYQRHGDFASSNVANLDTRLLGIKIGGGDGDSIINFLTSLTDPRVRSQSVMFDHPQLFVPNGQPGDSTAVTSCTSVGGVQVACDDRLEVPANGMGGGSPLGTFLGLSEFGG